MYRDDKWMRAPAKTQPMVQNKHWLAHNDYETLDTPILNKPKLIATSSSLGDNGCPTLDMELDYIEDLGLN